MTSLYKIENEKLVPVNQWTLPNEGLIEDWVESDPELLDLNAIIIGRQVLTAHGGRIDLLALDESGNLIVIELKKEKTSRETVAQALDYASWVKDLDLSDIEEIFEKYQQRCGNPGKKLTESYREHFEGSLPEDLNESHRMLIVASELDPASQRIIEYLSEYYGVPINTVFFNVFGDNGQKYLTTNFLLDQEEVEERSTQRNKKDQSPWSGYYLVNCGIDKNELWQYMKEHGFVAVDGKPFHTGRFNRLGVGDKIFAYCKGEGYVGYGIVTSTKTLASKFETPGKSLLFSNELNLPIFKDAGGNIRSDLYAVGVNWLKTFDLSDAKTFTGIFTNPNMVCKIKIKDHETINFLEEQFEVTET